MTDKLPPLPEPALAYGQWGKGFAHSDYFTAEQMHAYALAAVMAERERAARWVENQNTYGDQIDGWLELLAAKIRAEPAAPMEATK